MSTKKNTNPHIDKIKWFDIINTPTTLKNLLRKTPLSHEMNSILFLYEYNIQHLMEYHMPEKYKSLFKKLTNIDRDLVYEFAMKIFAGEPISKYPVSTPVETVQKEKISEKCQISISIPPLTSPYPQNQYEYIDELKSLLQEYLDKHTLSKCDICEKVHIPCKCTLCKKTHKVLQKGVI